MDAREFFGLLFLGIAVAIIGVLVFGHGGVDGPDPNHMLPGPENPPPQY